MGQQTITQQQQPERRGFKYNFVRSTWITAGWNWFLMFAGKAAEPVLTISVIYSCARLLPAVHFPVQLDNVVFLCQMVALDIGGLGLRKLANQARRDGNEDGANLAGNVSNALITIMCINVALSILTSIAHLPGNWIAVIEGILLVARAILAVLYSFVIHSLHPSDQGGGPEPHDGGHPQPDIQRTIDQALADQVAQFEQRLSEQREEIEGQFQDRFTSEVKRLEQQMEQRLINMRVSFLREFQQNGTGGTKNETNGPRLVPLPQRPTVSPSPVPPLREVRQPNLIEQPGQQETIAGADNADCKAAVYALLQQESSLQPAEIARRLNRSRTTVWRHWTKWHEEHHTNSHVDQVNQVERDETAS